MKASHVKTVSRNNSEAIISVFLTVVGTLELSKMKIAVNYFVVEKREVFTHLDIKNHVFIGVIKWRGV